MSDNPQPEIQINVKGPSELKLQITISPDKSVIDLKHAIAAKSDVEAERQRLIFSGRVLKDDDNLAVYKIQSGHTVHMVKGQARSGGSASAPVAPQQIPTMQTGQNIHDPLTQLNSHLGFGAMAGINPFADMGVNPNDPNMLTSMFNDPRIMQQMAAAMSNPAIIDQMIAMNPQLAAQAPMVRQVFQSEEFRRILSNPEQLQGFMRMASLMRDAQGGGAGGAGGFANPFASPPSFPAPGVPGQPPSSPQPPTQQSQQASASPTTGSIPPFSPLGLFGLPPPSTGGATGTSPGPGGFGGFPFGGFGNMAPPAPTDTRPPEERYEVQLQQLQNMGFHNASQNVRALLATGGNVDAAIDYIFSGGGL